MASLKAFISRHPSTALVLTIGALSLSFFGLLQALVLYSDPNAGRQFADWGASLEGSIGLAILFAGAVATFFVAVLGLRTVRAQAQRDLDNQIEQFLIAALAPLSGLLLALSGAFANMRLTFHRFQEEVDGTPTDPDDPVAGDLEAAVQNPSVTLDEYAQRTYDSVTNVLASFREVLNTPQAVALLKHRLRAYESITPLVMATHGIDNYKTPISELGEFYTHMAAHLGFMLKPPISSEETWPPRRQLLGIISSFARDIRILQTPFARQGAKEAFLELLESRDFLGVIALSYVFGFTIDTVNEDDPERSEHFLRYLGLATLRDVTSAVPTSAQVREFVLDTFMTDEFDRLDQRVDRFIAALAPEHLFDAHVKLLRDSTVLARPGAYNIRIAKAHGDEDAMKSP